LKSNLLNTAYAPCLSTPLRYDTIEEFKVD